VSGAGPPPAATMHFVHTTIVVAAGAFLNALAGNSIGDYSISSLIGGSGALASSLDNFKEDKIQAGSTFDFQKVAGRSEEESHGDEAPADTSYSYLVCQDDMDAASDCLVNGGSNTESIVECYGCIDSGFEDAVIPPSCSDVSGSAQYCGTRDVCLDQNCASSSCLGKVKYYFNCQYNEMFRRTETSCDICDHTILPGENPLSNRNNHSNSMCHNQELDLLSCLSGDSYTNAECVRCDLSSIDSLGSARTCFEMNGSPYCSERDHCIQTHCRGECQEQIESLFDCHTYNMFGNTTNHCNLCPSGQSARASIHLDMHTKENKDSTGRSALRGQGGKRMAQVHRTPALTASEWKTFFANKINADLSTVDNWVTDEELEDTQRNLQSVYADDDTAAQKLMEVEDNLATKFHEFVDAQHLAPESPLFQEYSDWSDLISNFDGKLISDEGELNLASLENLRVSCALFGINDQGYSFDVCAHVIDYLERRAPILDSHGALQSLEALVNYIVTKVIPHEEEPMCLKFIEELVLDQAMKSLDDGTNRGVVRFPAVVSEPDFDKTFLSTCAYMQREEGLATATRSCQGKLDDLNASHATNTNRHALLSSSCDAIGAPLEEPNLDAPSQKNAPGAITTRTVMLNEFTTAQHIKHGLIDKNGVPLKSSKQKPSVSLKEGCVKLNDGCIPGYPHYDQQGMVCGNDGRSDEAYCKYSEGPNACVIGCRDENEFEMPRNSQLTSTVAAGWGRSKEVGVTATFGSIALGAGISVGFGRVENSRYISNGRIYKDGRSEGYYSLCHGISTGEIGIEIGMSEGYFSSWDKIPGYSTATSGTVDLLIVDISAGVVECHDDWSGSGSHVCGAFYGISVGLSLGWPVGASSVTCLSTALPGTRVDNQGIDCGSCGRDGHLCAYGSSCNNCCTQQYNWGHNFPSGFKCGPPEPRWGDGTYCIGGSSCNQCRNSASHWMSRHPHGQRCGRDPGKRLVARQQCYKTGDKSNLVACWSKESLLEKDDISLNCFKQNYALSLHTLPGPHFLLLAKRKEGKNDKECPSNVALDYVEGSMAEVFVEDMAGFAQHPLGSHQLSDILQAQEKAETHIEKASEYNLETNTCLHYARDVWRSLGLADTVDMAGFIVEGVSNDSNFENLATKHSGGTGYLTAKASGKQELRNYIKDVVYTQLDVVTA